MKFCKPLAELYQIMNTTCSEIDVPLSVRTWYLLDQVQNITASIHCEIPTDQPIYWRHLKSRQLGYSHSHNEKIFESVDHFKHESELRN